MQTRLKEISAKQFLTIEALFSGEPKANNFGARFFNRVCRPYELEGFVYKIFSMQTENLKQVINLQVTDGLTVAVFQNQTHEFLMPTKDVALGYGVSPGTIRNHQASHSDDLVYGKHFIKGVDLIDTLGNMQPHAVYWTKSGIVRLGFIIQSKRGKMFRDWAESVILQTLSPQLPKTLPPVAKRNHNRLTQDRMISILSDVAKIDDKDLRLSLISKLGV